MPVHTMSEAEREPLLAATEALLDDQIQTADTSSTNETESNGAKNATDVDARPTEYDWSAVAMIASTWLGVILASMDASVMATLTGPISESFESFKLLSWFINAYTISTATLQPLSGKLSDIFGRRQCLLWANFVFLLGNLGCGLARKNWQFILSRAIAGLGGGPIHSISTFLISDLVPLRSRGIWQGISNVSYGVGFAFGGIFGGLVNDRFGWRWAFLGQPFLLLLSMLCIAIFVRLPPPKKAPSLGRIDFLGSLLLTLCLVSLMFGAISGGNTLPWGSPLVYVPLMMAPLLLLAFCYVELNFAKEPMIPLRLLRGRTIMGSCLACFCDTSVYSVILYYLPLFVQLQGLSATSAGLRLIPSAVGVFVGSIGSGALMNWTGRYYALGLLCQLMLVMPAAFYLTLLPRMASTWLPSVMIFSAGAGLGGVLTITLVALISATDHANHATLTSVSYAFRSTGNTVGITVAGALFQNILDKQLRLRFGGREGANERIHAIRRSIQEVQRLPASWRSGVHESYRASFTGVWTFVLAMSIAGLLSMVVIRDSRLSKSVDKTRS